MKSVAVLLGLLSLCGTTQHASAAVIHHEKSLYQDIAVTEADGLRCLSFAAIRGDRRQTCQYVDGSPRLVFPYTQMSLAGLLLNPHPQQILIVGLGGGSIPSVLHELYPEANITAVEIDPAVVKVAKDFFHFRESAQVNVVQADARVYIKRAGLSQQHYDFILLDAFNGDYIPEHLMTQEFLQETRALLTQEGVLVANTFVTSRLYAYESATYQQVFGTFFNFAQPQLTGNRVILASLSPLPTVAELQQQAEALAPQLQRYDIDILRYPALLATKPDWPQDTRPLTDQYSPANLLQQQ